MRPVFSGFTKIFSFTFAQHVKGRGYRNLTVILGLLCFLIPSLLLPVLAAFDKDDAPVSDVLTTAARTVCVVDEAGLDFDFSALALPGYEAFCALRYTEASDVYTALDGADETTLILALSRDEGGYRLRVVLPDESELDIQDAENASSYFSACFPYVLAARSGLNAQQLAALAVPVQTQTQVDMPDSAETRPDGAEETDGLDALREVLSFLIPYLNIMVLYFLVLIYGQGVANAVIAEKTSKLMDTFLVAVHPAAMILGKVLAVCLSAVMQVVIWLAALFGGLGCGGALARLVDPETSIAAAALFDSLPLFSAVFSLPGMIMGLLVIVAGFLLYCSLSAIGGALAGKPEDLSSTNMLFTFALIGSFFAALYSGGMGGTAAPESWLNFFPFTAVLLVPGYAALGLLPLGYAACSLALTVLFALALLALSGRLYRLMAFYRGNPPKPGKLISILRAKQS